MGNSLVGLRLLKAADQIPRDPLYGTRAVSVDEQYEDEVRVPGQPRFKMFRNVTPHYSGDSEDTRRQAYVCFARDDLLRRGIDPEALKGARVTGYMRAGTWEPAEYEVVDMPPRGHLPTVGPILVKIYLRPLKDLKGGDE